jgi:hypothetical protein
VESKWKNYHIITFLDSLFPVMETNVRCFLWRQNNLKVKYSPSELPEGNVFRGDTMPQDLQQEKDKEKQKLHHKFKLRMWNVRTLNQRGKLDNLKKVSVKSGGRDKVK